jgi:hypothetical protein
MDTSSSQEASPPRIRQSSLTINSSPPLSSPLTGATATFRTNRHPLDTDLDLSGAPFYFDADDGLTTMEQALRVISNFSRPNVSSQDDTINCKEWLLYLKCVDLSIDSYGERIDLKNRVSVTSLYHDTKHMLLVPYVEKSWISSIFQSSTSSASASSRKCRNETVYNLYDFYGNDVIDLDLKVHHTYLTHQSKKLATRTIPLCLFYDVQYRQISADGMSEYAFPMEVLFEVPSSELVNAGVTLPRNTRPSSTLILKLQLRFRLVSLRQCCRLSSYRHPRGSVLASMMNSDSYIEEVHELHTAAAYAPTMLLTKLLQSLARKSYLRRSMQLQSVYSPSSTPTPMAIPLFISHAKNAVDLTLAQGNYANAKLLFERMGNLCFLGSLIGSRSCALHYAVFGGNVKCVELVLKYVVYYGPIPVRGARDYSARIQDLIDWRDENDYTPLLLACQLSSHPCRYGEHGTILENPSLAGRSRVVAILLRFRADASVISSKTSKTALLLACHPSSSSSATSVNMDVIRMLFQAKKSRAEISQLLQSHPNLASSHSYRRWNCCIWSCYCKLPILSFFLGSNHKASSSAYTAIDSSNELSYDELVNSDHPYDTQRKTRRIPLLFLKCNIFHKDLDNKTAFTYAVESGNLQLVKLMVWCGVSYMDILDGDGNNIIHLSAKCGHDDLIDYIAELEHDRYRKYRYYVQRYPLQLIHYRMQIFRVKNALGLSPYLVALYAEQGRSKAESEHENPNPTSLLSAKIDYYCQLIYQPPVTATSSRVPLEYIDFTTARDQQVASTAAVTSSEAVDRPASSSIAESDPPEKKASSSSSSPSASAASAWHPGPFSALFSILLPSTSASKHTSESYLKSTFQSSSPSTAISARVKGVLAEQAVDDNSLEESSASDELEYDDEADDLAYAFSLAPKGIVSQNYYSVAQYANTKISADDAGDTSEIEISSHDQPRPAIAVIE